MIKELKWLVLEVFLITTKSKFNLTGLNWKFFRLFF